MTALSLIRDRSGVQGSIEMRMNGLDERRRFLSFTNRQWIIVLAISLCCMIWSGCGYFAFSLFVKPLQADLGWSRATITAAFMFWSLTVGVACIFAGKAVDQYGARRVMLAGAVVTGLGFFCLSLMKTVAHFYTGYIIVGAGIAAMGQVPSTAVISNWFQEKRGLALGLTSMGVGLGGLIISPLFGSLVIPLFGWRTAYVCLGLMACVIVIPLALFVIKSGPADSNAGPGNEPVPEGGEDGSGAGKAWRQVMSAPLWLIALAFLLSQTGLTGSLQSQVPHFEDIGFSPAAAATVLGGVGLVSSFSKFFFGWLCDLIKVKYAFFIAVLLEAGGTFMLMNILPDSPFPILWLYILVMGMGAG
ncbi:MAG: MFS transporter, partial [Pseudomonadota bacterium]